MNIYMALKSRSYILYLVPVKLSLIFFPELFNGELITTTFGIKNTQQKAENLMFYLTLTVGICSIQSREM